MTDRVWLYNADSAAFLATTPAAWVDAVVCDPPYELGFMGKKWDGTGIANSVPFWEQVLRVLKPGGHLLAFSGTRTAHRMICAIEDAGFQIRDSIAYMYGSGFPKSLNVGEGRGTALKPGYEPICLARKPPEGTVAANVTKWGTGALNIDACRIPSTDGKSRARLNGGAKGLNALGHSEAYDSVAHPGGRWPANVLLDEDSAAVLDTQMGGASRFFYTSKPSRKERDFGCEHLPVMSGGEATGREDGSAGTKSPRAGAGRKGGSRNGHPTVKPLDLMRYLVRLVTPVGGLVLDPFLGSGTTGCAAVLEGFRFVGIEKEAQYMPIASARIAAYSSANLKVA